MLGDELNALRWIGKRQRGFHEVWYLTCVDPTTGDAYWFRYTIESPLVGDVEVGLWAFATPKANPTAGLCLHDRWPLSKFADKSTSEKGFRVEVDKFFLEGKRATGKVGTGDKSIEWDLKFEPNGIGFEHVSGFLTTLGVAKSAVNSGNLAIEVDGTIKVGGKAVKVAKWPAHQSHTWGTRHAESWAWAHCNAFAEDKTAVFEGVSARVQKLGLLLPAASPMFFRRNGVEHAWSSVGSVWANRSTYAPGSWKFEAENEQVLIRGTASAPAERTLSVEYHDPAGPFYVDHCTSGNLELEVWNRVGFRWELDAKLTSQGTTAFEIAGRTRSSNVGRTLDLVDTKGVGEPAPVPTAIAGAR